MKKKLSVVLHTVLAATIRNALTADQLDELEGHVYRLHNSGKSITTHELLRYCELIKTRRKELGILYEK